MLTESMKKEITARFNRLLVNSTACVIYYWDASNSRFVSIKTYVKWTLSGQYYVGLSFQLLLAMYLYYYSNLANGITEESSVGAQTTNDEVLILIGIGIWIIITMLLAIGTINEDYRAEIIETMNQVWSLDTELKRRFPGVRRNNIKIEILIKAICWIPLLLPFIFAGILFHPSNPLRGLLEAIFEVPLTVDSPIAWGFLALQTYSVFCFTGPSVCLALMVLVVYQQCKEWLEIAAVEASGVPTWKQGELYFETEQLGRQSEVTLVWLYRSLQFVVGLGNLPCKTLRLAYHSVALTVVFVVCSFGLIRYGDVLLTDGSFIGYGLALMLGATMMMVTFVFYVECYFIDGMENGWMEYKSKLLGTTTRGSGIHKATKSFLPVALKTMHPYCNVNRSTFLEWVDVALNNLVSVLVL